MTPVSPKPVVKFLGAADGILPGHGIGNEQNFHRRRCFSDMIEFRHHLVVDVETAGGINQNHVVAAVSGVPKSLLRPGNRVLIIRRVKISEAVAFA